MTSFVGFSPPFLSQEAGDSTTSTSDSRSERCLRAAGVSGETTILPSVNTRACNPFLAAHSRTLMLTPLESVRCKSVSPFILRTIEPP
jgi:hypothetical protein